MREPYYGKYNRLLDRFQEVSEHINILLAEWVQHASWGIQLSWEKKPYNTVKDHFKGTFQRPEWMTSHFRACWWVLQEVPSMLVGDSRNVAGEMGERAHKRWWSWKKWEEASRLKAVGGSGLRRDVKISLSLVGYRMITGIQMTLRISSWRGWSNRAQVISILR